MVIKANCLFNKYLLNAYCMPETVLDTRDMAVKKYVKKNVQSSWSQHPRRGYILEHTNLQSQVVLTAREEKHCVL